MQEPRSAAGSGTDFPYAAKVICYIEVSADGSVRWGSVDREAVGRARSGSSRLFAVWPGQWASHLFAIDDLDACARGLGFLPDPSRTGLAEHDHLARWSVSRFETNPNASYVSIDVELDCGCTINDLKVFAEQMRQQQGWDVATSSGWGSSGAPGAKPTYSIRVRRKSLA